MGITQDQKAEAGNSYITEIKRRIDVRSKAKALVPEPKDTDGLKLTAMPTVARLAKRLHRQASDIVIRSIDSALYRTGPNARVVDVEFKIEGQAFTAAFDRKMIPEIIEYEAHNTKVSDQKKVLCAELEFLTTTALAPSVVAAFQSHAARLISAEKDAKVDKKAVALIDDFLTSRRGFTCTLK